MTEKEKVLAGKSQPCWPTPSGGTCHQDLKFGHLDR
jgi:hypothetical protein